MENLLPLFEEFLMKGITLTEQALTIDPDDNDKLDAFTSNRERLMMVIDQISRQVDWTKVEADKKDWLNQQIDYIKKLDEQFIVKLQTYQAELKADIEKTHRQKENIKGYNLNDVK